MDNMCSCWNNVRNIILFVDGADVYLVTSPSKCPLLKPIWTYCKTPRFHLPEAYCSTFTLLVDVTINFSPETIKKRSKPRSSHFGVQVTPQGPRGPLKTSIGAPQWSRGPPMGPRVPLRCPGAGDNDILWSQGDLLRHPGDPLAAQGTKFAFLISISVLSANP